MSTRRPAHQHRVGDSETHLAEVVHLLRAATMPHITPAQRERLIRHARSDMAKRPSVDWQWELGPWLWRFVEEEEGE